MRGSKGLAIQDPAAAMPPTEKPHAGNFTAARRYDYSSILALPTRAMKIRAMKI
ncbi:hypothetical protein NKI95_13935 [Mesorhizobium sp. M0306]|uniref:hypothetical protein n=1 Tax=Mesorhizobium sp. M0306 TaxID=2956932 RepID=UPI00333DF36E